MFSNSRLRKKNYRFRIGIKNPEFFDPIVFQLGVILPHFSNFEGSKKCAAQKIEKRYFIHKCELEFHFASISVQELLIFAKKIKLLYPTYVYGVKLFRNSRKNVQQKGAYAESTRLEQPFTQYIFFRALTFPLRKIHLCFKRL